MSRSQIEAMLAESEFAGDDAHRLHAVLAPLAGLAQDAPAPSAELRAIFGENAGSPAGDRDRVGSDERRPRGRGTVAGAVVLALAGVGATGLSAAANTLPHAWQHQVSEFSRHYLPFDLPEPAAQPPRQGEGPFTGRVAQSRAPQDAGGGSRDVVNPESTRALDRPRRAIEPAPPWSGPHDSGRDDPRDEHAAVSGPSPHDDESPASGPPAEVRAGAERPDREAGDRKAQDRNEAGAEKRAEERRGQDGGDTGGRSASGPSQGRGEQGQGDQAPGSGTDGEDAGSAGDAGQDADSPDSPEGAPATPPALTRIGDALGQALGQGDAPDA